MSKHASMTRAEPTQALPSLEDDAASDEATPLLRELKRAQMELETRTHTLQEAQRALEESRNRYVDLYDSAPVAYVSLDERAYIHEINVAGLNLLRQERVYLQGQPFTPFVDPPDLVRFLTHVRQSAEGGETLSTEVTLRIGDSRLAVRLHSAPCRNTRPHVYLCRTTLFDISELKQVQFRLGLSERLATVGTLAAGIAHEINNPLAFLMNNLDILNQALQGQGLAAPALADGPSPQVSGLVHKALTDAHAGAERIQDIVKDLATFARPATAQRSRISVQQVLELAVKLARGELRHRARLVRDYAKVPEILADASRLGQVFLNLLVNAAQSIPEGSADRNEIRLRLVPLEQTVLVQIRDTGMGMSPAALDRIFDPFYATKPEGKGSGLGLAISHSLIAELGGTITVESQPGVGTTFSIRLPAAPPVQEALPPTAPQGSAAEPSPRRGRILIVDDEPRFGQTLRLLLGRAHDVTYTPSAREALSWILEGKKFDAILCDLMMAEVTGRQFHEALSLRSPEHASRIIFMTGGAYTPDSVEFVAKMTNPLLDKPFKPEAVEKLLLPLLSAV